MDSSNMSRPSTASLDEDFCKSLSTYAVLQNLRDDLRHYHEDIAELLDILIGGIDVTASEIETEEERRSFDARTGLPIHQLGKGMKKILSDRIRNWHEDWEHALEHKDSPFDLPVPQVTKSDVLSIIEAHHLNCQDSPEMFLSESWMESTFGRQLTHPPYLGIKDPMVTWDDVSHFLSDTHRPKFEKAFANFASALPLRFLEAIPPLLHAGAVLEHWHEEDERKKDQQPDDQQPDDQQPDDQRPDDKLAKAVTCLSGPALNLLPMSRLQSVSSLRQSLPVMHWKVQQSRSNNTRGDSGRSLRALKTIPVYRSPNDADPDGDVEMDDDAEYVNQPAKKAYWASSFIHNRQERLPGWQSQITGPMIDDIVSRPGMGRMRAQLRELQRAPRYEHTDEVELASFLRGPLIFAAKCGLMTRSTTISAPGFCVEEILHLHRQQTITVDIFDKIMTIMVSNNGSMDVSYIPGALNFADTEIKQLRAFSEIFRPLPSPTETQRSKTVVFRSPDPRMSCISICEVILKRSPGKTTVLCEVLLFSALGNRQRDPDDNEIFEFRSSVLEFLERLFPSGHVPWAWWDQGHAQVAIRELIVIDSPQHSNRSSSVTVDPALQLLEVCCEVFTPHRFSALGKLMGAESLRNQRPKVESCNTNDDPTSITPLTLVRGSQYRKVQVTIARQITWDAFHRFESSRYDTSYWDRTKGRRQIASGEESLDSERSDLIGNINKVDGVADLPADGTDETDEIWDDAPVWEDNLEAQEEEEGVENPTKLKLPDKLFSLDDIDDDEKVTRRIGELLEADIQSLYHYSETIDATIEAASPLLKDTHVNRTDKIEALFEQYQDRWSGLLLANIRLCLSLNLEGAEALGIDPDWWRSSVANARKGDRERFFRRLLNPKNHPLDKQMILAQGVWSKDVFNQMSGPIDTTSPSYDGSAFNTAYLGEIRFNTTDRPWAYYFGSATGEGGEATRIGQHEELFAKTISEVNRLREKNAALFFHAVGVSEQATQRTFYALARFPKVDGDRQASLHSRHLALVSEQFFMVMSNQLSNGSFRRPRTTYSYKFHVSAILLEYFSREAQLPRRDEALSLRVLNRIYPMLQTSHHHFDQNKETVKIHSAKTDALHQFFLKTRKRHISQDDMRQISIDHNLDLPVSDQTERAHLRRAYRNILVSYGARYQGPHDDLLLPAIAGVIRHAFRAGVITAPTSNDSTELYTIKSALVDWHEASLDARELVPQDLIHLCSPAKIRDLWNKSIACDWGIARLALVPRNAHFFRDEYSMDQDVILGLRQLSKPVSKYLTEMCRSQYFRYFGSQRQEEPNVIFVDGVSSLAPSYNFDTQNIAAKVVARTLEDVSSEYRKQFDADAPRDLLTNCADLDVWIHKTSAAILTSLRRGQITEDEWDTWQGIPLWPADEPEQEEVSDSLDIDGFLFSHEPANQKIPVSADTAHLKDIVQELEKCGPKQLTSEQLSDPIRLSYPLPDSAEAMVISSAPKNNVFLLKRSVQDEDALDILFRPLTFAKRKKIASILPDKPDTPKKQLPAQPVLDDSSDDELPSCDQYISQVFHRYGDNLSRVSSTTRQLSFPTAEIELAVLLKIAEARRAIVTGDSAVDPGAIIARVLVDHNLPAPEEAALQRRRAVNTMIQRIFPGEPQVKLVVSGITPKIDLAGNMEMYSIFRDYVCSRTDQNPEEEVDMTSWSKRLSKSAREEVAAALTARFLEASGLRDSEYTVNPRSLKEMLRQDFSNMEQQYLSEQAARNEPSEPSIDTFFECQKCRDQFLTEHGAETCEKWKCLGQCQRCADLGLNCDSQRLDSPKCSNCTEEGAHCELPISPLYICQECKVVKALRLQQHPKVCKGQCQRCEEMGLRCRTFHISKQCLYCLDAGEECIGGNAAGTKSHANM